MSNANLAKLKKKAADFEQKKQFDRALTAYVQLLDEAGRDLDDADLQLFSRVGDLLQRQGNMSEALAYYEKAVDVYAERGFLNNAIALCNRILRQSPARTAVYYKLGKISAAKGFKSDAKKNFLEYADRMQKGGHVDEAFRALKEFADLCPDQDDIRLMLAEWLNKENRKSEALEQLETLYSKLEAEGRSAEARATIDRIKAIDPGVVPRPSGAYVAQKSNDLVFLDLEADVVPTPRATDAQPSPDHDETAMRTPESSRIPALDGLIITFDPELESGGEGIAPEATPDGFQATTSDGGTDLGGTVAEPVVMDGLEPTDEGSGEGAEEGDSLLALTVEAWGSETREIPLLEGLEVAGASMSGGHPALNPLVDGPPMSGEEFATLPLNLETELAEVATRPRGEHDLALPTSLPLMTTDEAPIDLLAVISTPLGAAAEDVAGESPASDGIDLLSLPPVSALEAEPEGDAPRVTGSLSPLDIEALPPGDKLAVVLDEDEPIDLERSLDALSGWEELSIVGGAADEVPDTSHSGGDAEPDEVPLEAVAAGSNLAAGANAAGVDDAAGADAAPAHEGEEQDAERPRHDTTELVTQHGTARATDEIIAVPSEEIDEEIKRSLRLEFALQEDGEPDTWVEARPATGIPDSAPSDSAGTHAGGDRADARAGQEALPSLPGESPLEETSEPAEARDAGPAIDHLESLGEAPSAVGGGEEPDINLLDELTPPFMRHDGERPAADVPIGPSGEGETRAGAEEAPADWMPEGIDPAPADEGEGQADDLPLLALDGDTGDEPALDLTPFVVEEDLPVDFLLQSDAPADGDASDEPPDGELGVHARSDDATVSGSTPEVERAADRGDSDEWLADQAPEVLIDGEWHHGHMGSLVSGEMRAIGTHADDHAPRTNVRFDDLAAAAMWGSPDDAGSTPGGGRRPTPATGRAVFAHLHTPRSTLSLGGVEAQLRRRLELDPDNAELRRQLGETLLDQGDREGGLAALDYAMRVYEQAGNLDGARSVADIVLRVIPSSIWHHQKRVEYAVRSADRVRLVEAYVELADALFRSGDPEKARVVYGRVLELAPGNGRARFALGLLTSADDEGEGMEPAASSAVHPPVPSAEQDQPIQAVATLFDGASDRGEGETAAHEHVEETSPPSTAPAALSLAPSAGERTPGDEGPAIPARDDATDSASRDLTPLSRNGSAPSAAPVGGRQTPRDGEGDEEEFIDLGSWLRAEEPTRSTRMVTVEATPSGDEQADFDEMLRRFKQGVAANVDEEDFASHYDLGVAYKEMGLVDEAIAEFQKSLRGDTHRVRSYEALGQCFVEKGQLQVASTLLRRAVETTGADDQQLVGVLYLLGYASEVMARHADALGYYQRVFAVDIEFRDVAQRVAAMEHVTQ